MTDPIRTDPIRLREFLPYQLSVASNAVSQLIAREYEARFGLSIAEWRLIAVLGQGKALTQTALVAATRMDKVTVSRATKTLVTRGLLRREPSATDGRSHHVRLSKIGRELYADVVPAALRIERDILAELPADQHALLSKLLADITAVADRLQDRL
jgi:DNA-binding MarR family transcriptional regulator